MMNKELVSSIQYQIIMNKKQGMMNKELVSSIQYPPPPPNKKAPQ
jgi:hypothetical protein